MLEKIDGYLAWFWDKPLRALCSLTGKSNFFFARCLIYIMFALTLPFSILLFLQENGRFFGLTGLCFFTGWLMGSNSVNIRKLEEDVERGATTAIRHTALTRKEASLIRICALLMGFFWLSLGTFVHGLYCYGAMLLLDHIVRHWAIDFQKPQTNLFRRAIEQVKQALQKVTPLHTPAPFPG
ncbi:hypothetical protein KBC99_02830 [Candidatus Saccharibacteria bacterium]|nr:hypothetical protein [Candidatus Saccharibacteria bacterium]